MRKTTLMAVLFIAVGTVALAATMTSGAYITRIGKDAGGGSTSSTSLKTKGSIGGLVDGETTSANWTCRSGVLPVPPDNWVHITQQPSPQTVGTGGISIFKWMSDRAGTYEVVVIATAGVIESGSCTASQEVEISVFESDLPNNASSEVRTTVTDGGGEQCSASVWITDDQIAPEFTAFDIVKIQGTVDDLTVTEIILKITGQPDVTIPVVSGSYDYTASLGLSPSGTTEVILEATNGEGKTVQKKIKIW